MDHKKRTGLRLQLACGSSIAMNTTHDKLLNGRLSLEQPARGEGYRVAVDSLLAAAAVPLCANDRAALLDMGCGVGAIMLAVGVRCPNVYLTGVEIHPPIVELCRRNILHNTYEERASVEEGDITALPLGLKGCFDHIVSNPPFHDPKGHTASPEAYRKLALMESEDAEALQKWVGSGRAALKEGGSLTIIFRTDRESELVAAVEQAGFEQLAIREILSKEDTTSKRIILHAIKPAEEQMCGINHSYRAHLQRKNPFILYGVDGRYSKMAEAVLRGAQSMADAMGE
ncbi:MAG: methyltransferase domain-containing protein [Proteobacteria bacterium]|nr:methyltransferase domain-containing protein [Pseudomonadota bacterium]